MSTTNLVVTEASVNFGSSEPKLASMSFTDLDSAITSGLVGVKTKLEDLTPYLLEMRELLSKQGKRTDLRSVPRGLTWQKWVEQKKNVLGSLSTVKRLLRQTTSRKSRKKDTPCLTRLEARLLGTASAGHDLVRALKQGGNVDAAVKDFLEHAPTPERIEEFIERPVAQADKLRGLTSEKLAEALAAEIIRLVDESGNGKRVRICGAGDEPILYESDTDCFSFTVWVAKEDPHASEVRIRKPMNAGKRGAQ